MPSSRHIEIINLQQLELSVSAHTRLACLQLVMDGGEAHMFIAELLAMDTF